MEKVLVANSLLDAINLLKGRPMKITYAHGRQVKFKCKRRDGSDVFLILQRSGRNSVTLHLQRQRDVTIPLDSSTRTIILARLHAIGIYCTKRDNAKK